MTYTIYFSVGAILDLTALTFDTYPRAHNLDITRHVFRLLTLGLFWIEQRSVLTRIRELLFRYYAARVLPLVLGCAGSSSTLTRIREPRF
jgi:hypothetical protein